MRRVGEQLEARTRDAVGDHAKVIGCCGRIVFGSNDQRRRCDAAEIGTQIHRPDRFAALGVALGIDARHHGAEFVTQLRVASGERQRQPPIDHRVGDRSHPVGAHELGALDVRTTEIRRSAQQRQPSDALGPMGREPHADHRTERQPDPVGTLHVESVERREHVRAEVGE